ncbi:MAG: hypothetical protein IJK98_06620 [Clostridia bacterium]|nr:hypothetical protein [Clostridia bacterium]
MKFGWINGFGAGIVALLLIPNIVYAIKHKGEKNLCTNKLMNALEQVGRYACIVLMWLPLLVWEFGFPGEVEMLLYLAGNAALLIAYWIVFARYFKEKSAEQALVLAILPACVFLLSGLTLRHWLLAAFAVVFAIGHIYVTQKNADVKQQQ